MRNNETLRRVQERKDGLCNSFASYLDYFDLNPPFRNYGQLEFHRKAIERRKALVSVKNAIQDYGFVKILYETLVAWGVNRGGKLASQEEIYRRLQENETELVALEGYSIDAPNLDRSKIAGWLWSLIEKLNITSAENKIVGSSKTLHHILPDLVPPIDRRYTRAFFGWYGQQFQYNPERVFLNIFEGLVDIAQRTNPKQYVDDEGWHTSRTKIIDNAITSYCLRENLKLP